MNGNATTPSAIGLRTIAATIEDWLARDREDRAKEGLATERDTYLIAVPCSHWPSHGVLQNWVDLLLATAQAIEAETAKNEGLGSKDESAVPESDAP